METKNLSIRAARSVMARLRQAAATLNLSMAQAFERAVDALEQQIRGKK